MIELDGGDDVGWKEGGRREWVTSGDSFEGWFNRKRVGGGEEEEEEESVDVFVEEREEDGEEGRTRRWRREARGRKEREKEREEREINREMILPFLPYNQPNVPLRALLVEHDCGRLSYTSSRSRCSNKLSSQERSPCSGRALPPPAPPLLSSSSSPPSTEHLYAS